MLADLDFDAARALTFLIVQVAHDDDACSEQSDDEIKWIPAHLDLLPSASRVARSTTGSALLGGSRRWRAEHVAGSGTLYTDQHIRHTADDTLNLTHGLVELAFRVELKTFQGITERLFVLDHALETTIT
jgi:hypothetical protein